MNRRKMILSTLFGAGGVGLRALATGLPASFLADPRRALADLPGCAPDQAQFIIFSTSAAGERPFSSVSARNRCSVLVYSSCIRVASAWADCMIRFMRGDSRTSAPYAFGSLSSSARASRATCAGSSVSLRRIDGTMPLSCSTSAMSKCSGVISACCASEAA